MRKPRVSSTGPLQALRLELKRGVSPVYISLKGYLSFVYDKPKAPRACSRLPKPMIV